MSTYFYSENDKSKNIYQPLFNRSRQKYRGPRESEIQNLEQDQILVDIARLKKKISELENVLLEMSESFYFHNSATPNINSATPFYDIEYKKYEDEESSYYLSEDTVSLSSQLFRLYKKLNLLENQEI
jgi:hypothetical protein